MKIHTLLGPGLQEAIYQHYLAHELRKLGIARSILYLLPLCTSVTLRGEILLTILNRKRTSAAMPIPFCGDLWESPCGFAQSHLRQGYCGQARYGQPEPKLRPLRWKTSFTEN